MDDAKDVRKASESFRPEKAALFTVRAQSCHASKDRTVILSVLCCDDSDEF